MKVIISSDFSNVATVSTNLKEFCEHHKIPEETIVFVDIMLIEAINNIIEHAYKGESNHLVDVEFKFIDNLLRICLRDTGVFFSGYNNFYKAEIPDENSLPERGWGLGLINSIADKVTYSRQNDVNLLILEKRLI